MRLPVLALAALLAVPLAAPAAAQLSPEEVVLSARFPHSPRQVYVAALDALLAQGYVLRIRSLDELLLTQPRFRSDPPGADEMVPQLRFDVEAEGDSTRLTVRGRPVPGRPRELAKDEEERAFALSLAAMVAAFSAADSALKKGLPTPADPREVSAEYGYGRENPVRVGGGAQNGVREQRRFLDALRGPSGEPVLYRRLGSCCPFPSPEGYEGSGALDAYEVTYEGLERPVVLFLEFYTRGAGPPRAPEGFVLQPAAAPLQES